MPFIYITGPTGAGKSTVCERLAELGYEAYDVDDEGMRVALKPPHASGKSLLTVSAQKIDELKKRASNKTIYLCGTFPTDQEHINDFDLIILLTIGRQEQEKRILTRTNSTYGKNATQLQTALSWRGKQIEKYHAMGAVPVDAVKPLDEIVGAIISHTPLQA